MFILFQFQIYHLIQLTYYCEDQKIHIYLGKMRFKTEDPSRQTKNYISIIKNQLNKYIHKYQGRPLPH